MGIHKVAERGLRDEDYVKFCLSRAVEDMIYGRNNGRSVALLAQDAQEIASLAQRLAQPYPRSH